MKDKKELTRIKRHRRIRLRIFGDSQRPRLVVHRSLKNLFAQAIDDATNKILFSLSTLDKDIRAKFPSAGNIKQAQFLGEAFAAHALALGLTKLVFDRAGYLYHGRIKAFAEGLRKGGIEI